MFADEDVMVDEAEGYVMVTVSHINGTGIPTVNLHDARAVRILHCSFVSCNECLLLASAPKRGAPLWNEIRFCERATETSRAF
jgi:hypothetical protein